LSLNKSLNSCGFLFFMSWRMSSNLPVVHAARFADRFTSKDPTSVDFVEEVICTSRDSLTFYGNEEWEEVLCTRLDSLTFYGENESLEERDRPRDLAMKGQAKAEGLRLLAVAIRLQEARDEADSAHAKLQQALVEVEEMDAQDRPNQANAQQQASSSADFRQGTRGGTPFRVRLDAHQESVSLLNQEHEDAPAPTNYPDLVEEPVVPFLGTQPLRPADRRQPILRSSASATDVRCTRDDDKLPSATSAFGAANLLAVVNEDNQQASRNTLAEVTNRTPGQRTPR
jgi:hypothetical protein